ncbi:MAG TPA: FHA domain-containing protein, partial [Ktedonobacteraceae bacterium]|nr:FHA domain-containing protein [Ktedonobacteraceae bacterium]
MKSLPFMQKRVSEQTDADQVVAEGEQTLLRPRENRDQESAEGDQTIIRSRLSIGPEVPENAKIYAFLDIQQNEQVVQRIALKGDQVVVGRVDPGRGIAPDIDLTPFDTSYTVSRQHARIHVEKDFFSLEDLKSRNKTRLGESTLTPLKPQVLHNGDVVSFGSVKATFRLLGTSELPVSWSQS